MTADLANPEWLWLLAALPVLGLRAAFGRARRARDWSALGRAGRPTSHGPALRLAAAVFLVLALARPRWGPGSQPPLPPGHDVVLAVDLSRSMAAEDAVPDRLGLAVEEAAGLVGSLGLGARRGERAAVVAFAGRGVLRCPLTPNLGAVTESLRALRPGEVRPGGTDLGAAIDAALEAFDPSVRAGGRAVVIFSDGEDHDGRWRDAAARAREQGVVVHTVAVGDAEHGQPVPLRTPEGKTTLTYQGEPVLSRRTDEALKAVAEATGGAFLPLGLAAADLGRLYREKIEPVAAGRREGVAAPEPAERFGVPLLAGLGLGLAACRPRRDERPGWRPARAWGLVGLAVLGLAAAGAGGDGPVALVARGQASYDAGRFAEALEAFRQARTIAPDSPVARYDEAAALFQLGRHAEARDAYRAARDGAGPELRAKVDFALGNTAVALRDLAGALAHYDDCLASTARGPAPTEVRRRAAVNRKFVEEFLQRSPAPAEDGPDEQPGGGDAPKKSQAGEHGPDSGNPQGTPPPGGPAGGSGEGEPSGRRGAGGAGGGGSAPPGEGTPEEQLDRAMDRLRDSRRQRLDDQPPPEVARDRKDW